MNTETEVRCIQTGLLIGKGKIDAKVEWSICFGNFHLDMFTLPPTVAVLPYRGPMLARKPPEVALRMASDGWRVVGGNPTATRLPRRALHALCLSDYGGFAWSKMSSADLHVVESAFG
jgi:hypothetical protein